MEVGGWFWLFVLAWVVLYWGTVLLVGGLAAWAAHRKASTFAPGAATGTGVAIILWSPLVPTDSGPAIALGWMTATAVGLASRFRTMGRSPSGRATPAG